MSVLAPIAISVIIPCHNHGCFLREAVESVISQTTAPLEVIVVDDGSTEDLAPAIRGLDFPRLQMLRQDNSGAASARNAGVSRSQGSLLAFLDSDDRWAPDRLMRALTTLQSTDSATMAFAAMQEFFDPDLVSSDSSLPTARILQGISASALVIARNDFRRVGPFDETLQTGEFIDWYLRADRLGIRTFVDDEILVYRRIHHANRDRWRRASSRDYARVLMRDLKMRPRNP